MSAIKFFTGLIVGALILFGAGFWTLQQRRGEERVLAQQSDASAVPAVSVVHPTVTPPNDDLQIAGSTQAYAESAIYARTSGYLKAWHADLGAHVKAGQLLAEIDTPETDLELQQTRAARQQLVASLELARSSAARPARCAASPTSSRTRSDMSLAIAFLYFALILVALLLIQIGRAHV